MLPIPLKVAARVLGFFLWVIAFLLTAGGLRAQISPGPLSTAHQDLEGATKCNSCHAFGLGQRALKCLDCHREIARRVAAKTGYHAGIYKATSDQLDCARCHNEHNGKRFQLTKFDRSKFDHAKMAGFELQGKHGSLTCESCHTGTQVKVQPAEIRMKDKNKTFLGMQRECYQCHQDPHKSEFGAECTTCHTQNSWKPAELFDHSKSSYPLTGKHGAVTCSGCHKTASGQQVPQFREIRYSSCDNCHKDPHRGSFENAAFQGGCGNCHVTAGWKALKTDAGFNHKRTKFPLAGKHADVTCFKCHTSSDFSQPVAHTLCADCHKDIHQGQFTARVQGSDCSACHNEQQFKPALYTIDQHQKSVFQLEGKHETTACSACHKPAGADTKYKLTTTTCQSCHNDPHGAQFAAEPYGNKCEMCHTQAIFHPATFTMAKHQQTRFTLTGAHQAVVCAECHKPLPGAVSVAARQYHFAVQNCTACHMDPHDTRETCETCHNTTQWKALRTFNHSATRFTLEGAHQTASCIGCHRPAQAAPVNAKTKGTANFAKTPTLCHECHEDIHGGQFMSGGEDKECTACHTVNNWSSRTFDHNKTKFSLEGAHAQVRCSQCHTKTLVMDTRETRLYRDAPLECKACHSDSKTIGKGIAQ
ncbi:MAG: cytochrome c3 family protein [Acidobacteriota bacterium]